MQKNIASVIVSKFGGAYSLSELIGLDVSQIYRWTYSKERTGGTGGKIPSKYQEVLLNKAKEVGVELKPDDFFDLASNDHKPKKPTVNSKTK